MAETSATATSAEPDEFKVSLVQKTKDGALRKLETVVTKETLSRFAQERARRKALIAAAKPVATVLPECKPNVKPPDPLFFEGSPEASSRAKLWGLHPVWGGSFKLAVRIAAVSLDVLTFPFGRTKSRILYSSFYRMLGFVMLFFAPFFGVLLHQALERYSSIWKPVLTVIYYGQFAIPALFFTMAWMLIFASIRHQNGVPFMTGLRPYFDPIPAYEMGPVIHVGHLLLSLKDCHTNIISFGGIGSGKCWAPGTRMLMFDGSVKAVEELRVGDLLMGPDSKPRKILSTTKGRAPMYWISEAGMPEGAGWGCNDVHMLTLKHRDGRPRPRWRALSQARQKASGHRRSPWFDGLYEVAGLRSFGTNERTGKVIIPQDLAEVELKGFLERSQPGVRKGFGVSRIWKMFRVPVNFEESEQASMFSTEEFYIFGSNYANGALEWAPEIFLRASRKKRLQFLAGWIENSGHYEDGHYSVHVLGEVEARRLALVARTLGFLVKNEADSITIAAGGVSLSDIPVRALSARAKKTQGGGRDPLTYDWKVEERGMGAYYGFTVEGDGRLLLEDCTVTHNTASFVNPTLLQFFRKLNNPDHRQGDSRWGGLVLDVKGDFIDFVIYCFRLTGRPLIDLVIIDPDIDLVRYNPLDSSDRVRFAEAGAAKLAAVQRIMGSGGGNNDKYWNETSKDVIQSILKTLQVIKDTKEINLADVGRYARDDDMVSALIKEAKARLDRDRYQITEEEYNGYTNSVEKLRNEWVSLSENTKSILKTTISGMLGPIVGSVTLQKCFCRETNFDFRQVITQGKVVLFRGSSLDRETRRLIAVCLKMDFQVWAQRRNGASKQKYGLDQDGGKRTILFVCDEYQEYVTTGGEGDEAFYGVSRSCLVCAILATQHVTSLRVTIRDKEQTDTLINNICTKVFLNSPDQETGKLGEYLGSQFEKEQHSNTVGNSKILHKESGQDGQVSVSKQLQQHFRADQFANLLTIDMEKSRKGPWYSEAIVYHYNQWEKGPTKMHRTRLMHCYPPRDYMAKLSQAYDVILRDRNAQRIIWRAGLALQATAAEIREARGKEFDMAYETAKSELAEASRTVSLSETPETPEQKMQRLEKLIQEMNQKYEAAKTAANDRQAETFLGLLNKYKKERTTLLLSKWTNNKPRSVGSASSFDTILANMAGTKPAASVPAFSPLIPDVPSLVTPEGADGAQVSGGSSGASPNLNEVIDDDELAELDGRKPGGAESHVEALDEDPQFEDGDQRDAADEVGAQGEKSEGEDDAEQEGAGSPNVSVEDFLASEDGESVGGVPDEPAAPPVVPVAEPRASAEEVSSRIPRDLDSMVEELENGAFGDLGDLPFNGGETSKER